MICTDQGQTHACFVSQHALRKHNRALTAMILQPARWLFVAHPPLTTSGPAQHSSLKKQDSSYDSQLKWQTSSLPSSLQPLSQPCLLCEAVYQRVPRQIRQQVHSAVTAFATHHTTPACIPLRDLLGKLRVHQQVGQLRVAPVRVMDLLQEHGADDAAALRSGVTVRGDGARVTIDWGEVGMTKWARSQAASSGFRDHVRLPTQVAMHLQPLITHNCMFLMAHRPNLTLACHTYANANYIRLHTIHADWVTYALPRPAVKAGAGLTDVDVAHTFQIRARPPRSMFHFCSSLLAFMRFIPCRWRHKQSSREDTAPQGSSCFTSSAHACVLLQLLLP